MLERRGSTHSGQKLRSIHEVAFAPTELVGPDRSVRTQIVVDVREDDVP